MSDTSFTIALINADPENRANNHQIIHNRFHHQKKGRDFTYTLEDNTTHTIVDIGADFSYTIRCLDRERVLKVEEVHPELMIKFINDLFRET